MTLDRWTVEYGDGHGKPVSVPHAWRQDVPATWEGPALYRTRFDPAGPLRSSVEKLWLVFHGVSYACVVRVNGVEIGRHEGLWDAFSVWLGNGAEPLDIEVEVVKNGGPSYPVRDVASGFLPFVFHTFGGIYKPVEVVTSAADPLAELPPAPPSRVEVRGTQIFVEGKPFYLRAPLTWGWYPDPGSTNPTEESIRREVAQMKALGFNTVKFCLWIPPHRYLEILRDEGMEAWLELPLWDPAPDPAHQAKMFAEIERIVRQYRKHDNVIVWTAGCELSESTTPEFRQALVELIRRETGCPLIKDNSGGAEMYGGDLREFGDFYDFHPYCDTPFYPPVLDSLLPGPRPQMPTLLGEFNDVDVLRDMGRLAADMPYWASSDPKLNDQGVRWQHDLPQMAKSPLPPRDRVEDRGKALFMRKYVQEAVRALGEIGGYVVTGWRDTPIATAGMVDDWGDLRFSPEELGTWNGSDCLFLIPNRRPPWVDGGNRPGWIDPFNHFEGRVHWRIGCHSEQGLRGPGRWQVAQVGKPIAQGQFEAAVPALRSVQVAEISWSADPGEYVLQVEIGPVKNEWPVWVVPKRDFSSVQAAAADRLILLEDHETVPMPFWREAAYEFRNRDGFWDRVPFANRWERLMAVSPDRAIDMERLAQRGLDGIEVLLNRIDARTHREHPILVRARKSGQTVFATTLRPHGGLGIQPHGTERNPSGSELLWRLCQELLRSET